MRLLALPLLLLLLAGVVIASCSREEAAAPSVPVDLVQARAAFVQGDVEESRGWVATIVASDNTPIIWLLEGLRHEDRGVREWSAHILGDLALREAALHAGAEGKSALAEEQIVAALIVSFEDEDDWVRWKAARALGNIGPAARAALPMLERAAADVREEVVHAAAKKAVAQIRAKR